MYWKQWLSILVIVGIFAATAYAQTLNDKQSQALVVCGTGYCSQTTSATASAGERNTSSSTLSYVVVRQETNMFVVTATPTTTINGGVASDSHLMGVHVLTALSGRCRFGGFGNQAAVATDITLATATAAGFKDFYGAINDAGALTVTCENGADRNNVLVLWRPR